MNDSSIGSQITKFRKASGITQEELGRAVGVSTQAVSRWECGGAPDVTLLPAIADRLGVTVDALFGREGGQPTDIQEAVKRWLLSEPQEKRIDALCRMVWRSATQINGMANGLERVDYLKSCWMKDPEGTEQTIMRTMICMEDGLFMGVGAEDLSYMGIFPEPKDGYAAFFADSDAFRTLFHALSLPGALEVLYYLYSEKERFYSAGAIARQASIEYQEAETIMDALTEAHILSKRELMLEKGLEKVYIIFDESGVLAPFLYLAQWLGDRSRCYHIGWKERQTPILRKPEGQTEKGEK